MQRVGLEPEGRKFTPHVTLARLRESSSRDVADYLATRAPFGSARFRCRASCCSPRAPRSAAGRTWSRRIIRWRRDFSSPSRREDRGIRQQDRLSCRRYCRPIRRKWRYTFGLWFHMGHSKMAAPAVRRADFLMALAYATDLATGHSRDFALRSCVLAMRFAEVAGLDEDTRRSIYHQALLRYIGCNADTHLLAAPGATRSPFAASSITSTWATGRNSSSSSSAPSRESLPARRLRSWPRR